MNSNGRHGGAELCGRGPGGRDDDDEVGDPLGRERGPGDRPAERRDQEGKRRDHIGERRDHAAEHRDDAAELRDRAAARRDQAAASPDGSDDGVLADTIRRMVVARGEAAADRMGASRDRRSGASERTLARDDRNTALADREASAREREHACLDHLTGGYLRGPGLLELEREMARARRTQVPLVLAFVDVDGLKAVNDTSGHAAGDRLLQRVAHSVRAKLRAYDLVIRYGGDEFVCTVSGQSLANVTSRFGLVNTVLAEGPEFGSVTVGFAELQDGDSVLDFVARADAAMYRRRCGGATPGGRSQT